MIDLSWGGSKAVLAAALSALVADNEVMIEIESKVGTIGGCAPLGQYTRVQSIYIMKKP